MELWCHGNMSISSVFTHNANALLSPSAPCQRCDVIKALIGCSLSKAVTDFHWCLEMFSSSSIHRSCSCASSGTSSCLRVTFNRSDVDSVVSVARNLLSYKPTVLRDFCCFPPKKKNLYGLMFENEGIKKSIIVVL